jgi:hypothetical protein
VSKTHTERPRSGNARLAWDYFCETRGRPKELYYSPFCESQEGPAWIAEYQLSGATCFMNQSNDWISVTNGELKYLATNKKEEYDANTE